MSKNFKFTQLFVAVGEDQGYSLRLYYSRAESKEVASQLLVDKYQIRIHYIEAFTDGTAVRCASQDLDEDVVEEERTEPPKNKGVLNFRPTTPEELEAIVKKTRTKKRGKDARCNETAPPAVQRQSRRRKPVQKAAA